MSAASKMFTLGGVFVGGLSILGNALYWFLTPMAHPEASQARIIAVGVQALAGLAASAYACMRARRESDAYELRAQVQ